MDMEVMNWVHGLKKGRTLGWDEMRAEMVNVAMINVAGEIDDRNG